MAVPVPRGGFRAQWRLEPVQSGTASKPSSGKPADSPDKESNPIPEFPPSKATEQQLDCGHLTIGDVGTITHGGDYMEVVTIIDDWSCVVLPYEAWDIYNGYGYSRVNKPLLPIVLKGLRTGEMVTGQKGKLSGLVFRVTGTQDLKKKDGDVIRVHVLEVINTLSK